MAAVSGLYGISPSPSTTPTDPGTPAAAPSASTAAAGTFVYAYGYTPCCVTDPGRASCACRSQFASFSACQMPLKSGFPSAVRAARVDEAVPPRRDTAIAPPAPTTAARTATISIAPVDQPRIRPSRVLRL